MYPRDPPSTTFGAAADAEPGVPDERLAPSGFELRLTDGRAYVIGAGRPLAQGVVARRFRMEVPRIRFPFDLTGGADRFRDQRCLLRELELAVDAAALGRWIAQGVDLRPVCVGALEVAARPGFLELSGVHPLAGPFTAKLAMEVASVPDDQPRTEQSLGVFLYDFRLYQPSTLSAAEILHSFASQIRAPAEPQPLSSGRQAAVEVLAPALRQLLVPRGFRIPETTGVGLRRIEVLTGQVVLTFEENTLPSDSPVAAELVTREGQRGFGEVEAAIAGGQLERARAALRDFSEVESHPFAAERLLQLLAADPPSHDLALDLCALLRKRSPVPPVALWVEAVLREELGGAGEWLRAAQSFLDLAESSLAERALFSAAMAARRAADLALRGADSALAMRAYGLWESAVPNDVDALMGLADLAEQTGELSTAIAALRRIAAFAQEGPASARAHGRLGRLLLDKPENASRARLHLDQALRQNPEDLPSLLALAESCERSGEWVRAVRLQDRAAELARQRGEPRLSTELYAKAAATWETQLGRPENALLRFRNALSQEPEERARRGLLTSIARVSHGLGLQGEALDAQREVTQLSQAGRPRAEAYLEESRLLAQSPDGLAQAEAACANALTEDPTFREAAEELVRLRRSGPVAELREALTTAAALSEPATRAHYLIERGDLELRSDSRPGLGNAAARDSFEQALAAVPIHTLALTRLAAVAESLGDHVGAAEAVARLAEQASTPEERAERLRRLADLASWITDPETAARVLTPAAAHADAPLPVLLRLLDVERSRFSGTSEAQLQLALRIAAVAEQAQQPELARSVLLEQLDRVEHGEEVRSAQPLLERALELDSTSVEVHEVSIRLARLLAKIDEKPTALQAALEQSVKLASGLAAPRRLEIWRELAGLYETAGRRSDAIETYRAMRGLNPDDLGSAQSLVALFAAEQQPGLQAEALDELSNLLWRKGERTQAADSLVALAELVWRDEPQRATETLRRAVAIGPSNAALETVAGLAESLGETGLAVEVLMSLSHLRPTPRARAQAFRRAARVVASADQSLALGLRAHSEDPSFAWGQLLAAVVALQDDGSSARALELATSAWGASEEGANEFEGALSEDERSVAEAVAVAASRALGQAEGEELWLSRLERRDSKELAYGRRRLQLLQNLVGLGENAATVSETHAHALALLIEKVASRLSPDEATRAWTGLGEVRWRAGDSQGAATAFRRALDLSPGDSNDALPALVGLLRSLSPDDPDRSVWRSRLLRHPPQTGNPPLLDSTQLGELVVEEARSLSAGGPDAREAAREMWVRATALVVAHATEPWSELARLHREVGDLRQSAQAELELSKRLASGQEAERGAAVLRALELLQRAGATDEARVAAEEALAGELPKATTAPIWRQLADLRAQAGDVEGELIALERAAAAAPLAERAALQLRRANRFLARGEREAERMALSLALPGQEHDLELLRRLRAASEALGDDEAVADTLELTSKALSQQGDSIAAAAAVYRVGELARDRLQKPRRAEAAFRRVLELAPDHSEARRGLAELLIARGDPESLGRGLDLLIAGLALEPAATRTAATLSLSERAAALLGRPDIALKLLRRLHAEGALALGDQSSDRRGAALGAELLYAQGATEEALRWLEDAHRQLGPASNADSSETRELRHGYELRLAELLSDLGRDGDALEATLALLATPPHAEAAVDLLRGLVERDAPASSALAESVLRIVGEIRSFTRALALLDAEVRRELRQGQTHAAIAERLETHAQQMADARQRRVFQIGLARLRDEDAIAALLRTVQTEAPVAAARSLRQIAEALLGFGETMAAAAVFERAAAQFAMAQDSAAAAEALRRSVTLDRRRDRVLRLADLLHGLGRTQEGAELDAEICALGDAPPAILERRVRQLRNGGDARQFAAFLEQHARALASTSAPAASWIEAAAVRRTLGESAAELANLREAFSAQPSNAPTFAALVARAEDGELPDLLLRRAAAVPSEASTLVRLAAELFLKQGRLLQAGELLDEVLRGPGRAADALVWAVRLEVAAAQHQPLEPWLPGVERALLEGVGTGLIGEALPRATAALLDSGMAEKAQQLLDLGMSMPELKWGQAVLELAEAVAAARGDRVVRLRVRQALLRHARGDARGPALQSLLEILATEDVDAPAVLQQAWQEAQDSGASRRSSQLARRLVEALEHAQRFDELADLLTGLLDEPLAPAAAPEDQLQWALRASELFRQQGKAEKSSELAERAFREVKGSPDDLRHLLSRQLPPELRAKVLWEVAATAHSEERALLLLERARLAEQKLGPDEAAGAWQDVLREGPGSPAYLQALERTLSVALGEGRFEEAANTLVAQADAVEGGQERAQLLEKAAKIRETQLADIDGALELFRRAAAESGDVRWFATLAEAYDRAGRTAEAAAALGVEVARREPGERRREQQRKLGLLLARELNRPADALPHLRSVALVDAQEGVDDPTLLEALADCARATGDAESELMALAHLPRSSDPSETKSSWLRQAELLTTLGRAAEAAELWNGLLQVDPGCREAFEPLSVQLRERKAWRELEQLLGRHAAALDGMPVDRAKLLVARGMILESQLEDLVVAEQSYREALVAVPTEATALSALRRLVDARGDQGELAELLATQIASSSLAEAAPLALHLGELQLRLGSPERAVENLRRALAGAERAPMLLSRVRLPLAQAELELGNAVEALAQAEAALLAGSPDSRVLLALAGQASLRIGERLRALGHFRELLNRFPGDPAALVGLEYLSRDQLDAIAAEALSQRIAHEEDAAGKAQALRELAALREAQNDLGGAEAPLREAVRLDPDDEPGFARLRQLLESEGRFKELADVLRERARGTADEVVRAVSLAEQGDLLRTHLHNPAGASEAYQRSLEILPRASTSEGYAEALVAMGSDELAAEHYRRALAGGGHLGEFFLLYRLGGIARRLGDKRGAFEQFRRSVEVNPSFLPAREEMVALAEEVGSNELALEALRGMAQQLDPQEFAAQVAELELRIAEIEKRALHFDAALTALQRAAELQPNDPRPLERLAALYQNNGRWAEAVRALEQLASRKPGAEAAVPLTAAGEISFDKLADPEQASGLFERALAVAPAQEAALRRSMEIAVALGKRGRLLSLGDVVLPGYFAATGARLRPTPAWLDLLLAPLAQAYEQAGRLEEAQILLRLARERAPLDLELLQRQSAIARQTGRLGDEADLEEELIGHLAEQKPFEAATRLRALARRFFDKTDDHDRARRLLERAAELAPARPEDRRLLADLWAQTADPALHTQALSAYLELLRRDPVHDLVLLRRVGAAAEALDRPELAQMANSLLGALEGAPEVGPVPALSPLGPEAWSSASFAAVDGLDRIFLNLAPHFEPLFAARLTGHSGLERLGNDHGPDLFQLIEHVRESLGLRPVQAYLAPSEAVVTVEATRPAALIVGGEAGRALGEAPIQWWVAQQLALNELGYTLPNKFSPVDVHRLAALVTLFLSDAAPVSPAEREQLGAFLDALKRSCPPPVKAGLLGNASAAVRDLERFDPLRFVAAARARASRIALLLTGNLRAAIGVLQYQESGLDAPAGAWELPSVKALIDWAFSDEYLGLRRSALGRPTR